MSEKYRLIWFQHLQKAAGTSIIQMAIHNSEALYRFHRNGNPYNAEGKEIRLWEMESQKLKEFIDRCHDQGVTFVATEKAAPIFSVIASDPRVCLITCLRDPLARFMSHFYYSFYTGISEISSPERFVNSIYISTMSNYYCRIFSGFNDNPNPVSRQQYEIAMSTLRSFHCCVVLENNDPFSELYEILAWGKRDIKANQTRLYVTSAAKLLAKGKIKFLLRRVTHPRRKPDENFTAMFKEQNFWDYKLYKTIKEGQWIQ